MKAVLLTVLTICLSSCSTSKKLKESVIIKNDTTMVQQYGEIEKYDFISTEDGTKNVIVERGGWIINRSAMRDYAFYAEYAPACSFYQIVKGFYGNGIIRYRWKVFGSVRFGMSEEFDEDGKLIKLADEDKKFGKLKPNDIVAFLEKEGWFNRQTGENIITPDSILPTNGYFYKRLMEHLTIRFAPIGDPFCFHANESNPQPKWIIEIKQAVDYGYRNTLYYINGETGEFEKKVGEVEHYVF